MKKTSQTSADNLLIRRLESGWLRYLMTLAEDARTFGVSNIPVGLRRAFQMLTVTEQEFLLAATILSWMHRNPLQRTGVYSLLLLGARTSEAKRVEQSRYPWWRKHPAKRHRIRSCAAITKTLREEIRKLRQKYEQRKQQPIKSAKN